jgi:tRNA U38,U39,U40 pseudouridine synthase TruA
MKKLVLIIVITIIAVSTSVAQKVSSDKVPASVMNAFKAKFPSATNVKWEMEKSKEYEAEFKLSGAEYSANFNQEGKWLETEIEIEESQLPMAVSQAISKDFAGFKVDEAEKTETSDNKTFYEVDVTKNKEKYEVQISPSGEILKKKAKKQDND